MNAASYAKNQPVTLGSFVAIFGSGFGDSSLASTVPWPTTLGQTTVLMNGVPGPLYAVTGGQINAQVPFEALPPGQTSGSVTITVQRNGQSSAPQYFQVASLAPGIFSIAGNGLGLANAVNTDGALAAASGTVPPYASHPAVPGGTIIVLATGLGATDIPVQSGQASSDTLRRTTTMPTVLVGGIPAEVAFSGLSPQFPAVNQLNIVLPLGVPTGSAVPIGLSIGGVQANTVTIAVAPPSGSNPAPFISSLSPPSVAVGSPSQTIAINGTNFLTSSTVAYNGAPRTATFVSSTQLAISLSAGDLASAGTYAMVVTNPSPGGGPSNSVNFTVNNPLPKVTGLSPTAVTPGAAAQTLTISGTNFVSGSTVTYNGVDHPATFVSSNRLTISLSATDQAKAGFYRVLVTNPRPGGGASNPLDFTVQPAGTLSVEIQGLPAGTAASVSLTNSNGFSQILTQTTTLTTLNPGTYSASAAIVAGPFGSNAVYIPSVSGSPASATATGTAAITISYSILSTMWQAIGPLNIPKHNRPSAAGGGAGKLQAFAVNNGNPAVMYAAGGIGPGNSGPYSEAGVYKTTDGGSTWQQIDRGLTDPAVDVLWLDQDNPNIVVAGTFTAGIFRSTDGGASWALVAPLGSTTALLQSGSTLYAGTSQGVAASLDNGGTWTVVQPTTVPVRALAGAGGTIYAGLDDGRILAQSSPSSAWKTASLPTSCGCGTVWSIAVNPRNAQNAFVVEWHDAQNLYVTTDGGATWQPIRSLRCPAQVVALDPAGTTLYAGCGGALLRSSDGGNTWIELTSIVEDLRLIVPSAAGINGQIIVGGDQGLFISKDGGSTWESLTATVTSSILYGVDVNGSTIVTTVQDYDPILSFDGGVTWHHDEGPVPPTGFFNLAPHGEGGQVTFNPGNPQDVYIFSVYGFQYSQDGGNTFTVATALQGDKFNGRNGDIISISPANPSTIYVAGSDGAYKSTDWGVNFTPWPTPASLPIMIAVHPTDSETIFVTQGGNGSNQGFLYVTHDGGATWTTSNVTATCGYPAALAVDPANPEVVFIGMAVNLNNGCGGLLKSTDGGTHFAKVNNGIQGRPQPCGAASVPHIRFDPSGSGIVAAATNSGLYLSSDLGNHWTNIRGNAVPYSFTEPAWSSGYLYASTCGQGVLRMPFPF